MVRVLAVRLVQYATRFLTLSQVIAWYQFGSGGRTTPTAWFKGGPTRQNVHAYSYLPNPDAVLYIKQSFVAAG